MSVAVESQATYDLDDVPRIVGSSFKLGLIQAAVVFAFSLVSRFLGGPLEMILEAALILLGLAATTGLPALWTRARSGSGIAAAAGIGLGATIVFLLTDVVLLQRIGTYTNRWLAIGGGSNWWYHPVWWMAGTYLTWMGATIIANQTTRTGTPSIPGMISTVVVFAGVLGVVANVIGFPGAGWNLATFAIACLPGYALTALVSWMRVRHD